MSTLANSSGEANDQAARAKHRRTIRYVAGALCAVTAVIYFLIGFHVVSVLDGNVDQTWGLGPALAYAFGAFLLFAYDRRLLWILGAILQVFVIYTYFNLASQRAPAFEVWGILIRIVQVMILVALVYLEVRLPLKQPVQAGRGENAALRSHG